MDKDVLRFIDKLFKDLYKSEEVLHHSKGNIEEKYKNIEEYINTLEKVHNYANKNDKKIALLKKMYHDKYIIKKEDIPESYYKSQERIALERGFGHITINEEQKKELENEIIDNQIKSLDTWLDYILSEDAKFYPFWAKYWAFQGMIKLGTFDKTKYSFNKRTKETVSPFADLNREALAKAIDLIIKFVGKEEIEDKELSIIVETGTFQKIYPYILKNVLTNNKNIIKRNQGKWIKYNQGSDHMPLVNSLKGYNTGWCTAGESTAQSQLANGDFYVYYTLDENDEYKIPRIAIRMENDKIGEIRGIAKDQNLEPEMNNILEEKLKEFPDRDKYKKKVKDMNKLTIIYNEYKKRELSKEELRFLYEVDGRIDGFGYSKDPRIKEILENRNFKEDLAKVFNCSPNEISNNEQDIIDGKKIVCFYEGLNLYSLTTAEGLKLPEYIGGDLDLRSLTTVESLVLPNNIGGYLDLGSLTTAEGLKLPNNIGENLYLRSLRTAEGLKLPKYIGGGLDLRSLRTAEGLVLPNNIGGFLDLRSLRTAEGLKLPEYIGGYLDLGGLTIAEGLKLPNNIGVSLWLSSLTTAEGLVLPNNIGGDLYLCSLTTIDGVIVPENFQCGDIFSDYITLEDLINKSKEQNSKRR